MINETKKSFDEIIGALPVSHKVLDVGAVFAPTRRADYILDILPYEQIRFNQAKGPGEIRFSKDTLVQFDICSRQPWPFPDKFFDYSICSHTLEDIRDPLWVCSELIRVSKAGYIEVPSQFYERTFGVEAKGLAGNAHHRWLIDIHNNKLRFTFKYFFIHKKFLNKSPRKKDLKSPENFLRTEWEGSFDFFENWIGTASENYEFFLREPVNEEQTWRIYRKLQDRNFFVKWLAYLKNTNKVFAKIFKKFYGDNPSPKT